MTAEPTLCVTRSRPTSAHAVGLRVARTPCAVLADRPIFAHGLAQLVRRIGMVDVVTATTELADVLDLVHRGAVRLVVIKSPRADAHEALGLLSAATAATGTTVGTILVVPCDESPWPDDGSGVRASAVVTTDDGVDGLARAVFEARQARRPSVRSMHRPRPPAAGRRPAGGRPALTPRELEVLQGIVDGLASKHIAEQLGVSVHTVRTHVQRLLPKLGAHTRLRAMAVALEEGLVAQSSASRLAGRPATTVAGGRSVQTAG